MKNTIRCILIVVLFVFWATTSYLKDNSVNANAEAWQIMRDRGLTTVVISESRTFDAILDDRTPTDISNKTKAELRNILLDFNYHTLEEMITGIEILMLARD